MITLTISRVRFGQFEVDNLSAPGSPPVGRGPTINSAIGDYFYNNQEKFGVQFELHESAQITFKRKRRRELRKR